MNRNKNSIPLIFLFFLVIVFVTFSALPVEGRKHHIKKPKNHKHNKGKSWNGYLSPIPTPTPTPNTFKILSYGASGNGVADDSKALLAAWKAACKVNRATVLVPAGFKFLIKPITLQGPCMPHLVLQVDGSLLAPPQVDSWPKSSLFQWINFKWLQNFTIKGSGTVDGQGFEWWSTFKVHTLQIRHSRHIPYMKPTALRFYSSTDVTVRDIRIISSPLCHLKFDSSRGIKVNNITISSPEDSPNTDGIHLQNTQDVEIQNSNIASGDDCVSIQTGCSNIHVHDINCGPGHGISLGGLGKDRSVACVSNIVIKDISIQNTLYGVRIKTWQGGIGSVKNVTFSKIKVSDVKVPIMIDQYYRDKHLCKNQTGTVVITGVKFDQIFGTYSAQPIHIACSNDIPCTDVDLYDIQLRPSLNHRGFQQALCWNSYGKSQAPLQPSAIDYCVRGGGGSTKRIARSHESVCKWN